MPGRPTRRQLLSGAAVAALAACAPRRSAAPPVPRPPTAVQATRVAAASTELALAALSLGVAPTATPPPRSAAPRATGTATSQPLPPVTVVTAAHRAHARALEETLPLHLVPEPGVEGPAVPPSPAPPPGTARSRLVDAQLAAASAHVRRAQTAPPALARLLASVAASDAAWAQALRGTGPPGDPASPGPVPAAGVAAWQQALAGEHAVVYGYGVVGVWLAGPARADALACLARHQGRRDGLAAALVAVGAVPTPPAPGYRLPFPVASTPAARALAGLLEARQADRYADLVAAAAVGGRAPAAEWLASAAAWQTAWTAVVASFPGLPERAAG